MGENIGLGCVERVRDADAVRAAAEAGGASACIAKLRHGLDTVLDPQTRAYGENVPEGEDDPLRQRLEALDKPIEVSGGETQRIVAYVHIFAQELSQLMVKQSAHLHAAHLGQDPRRIRGRAELCA